LNLLVRTTQSLNYLARTYGLGGRVRFGPSDVTVDLIAFTYIEYLSVIHQRTRFMRTAMDLVIDWPNPFC
jgi:hypothetical protein